MFNRNEEVMVARIPVWVAPILGVLLAGCEGDLPAQLMQRDLDSVRSEVAAVSRMNEAGKVVVEDRLGKLEAEVKNRLDKANRERTEDIEGFLRSQASLNSKLDELADQARATQGRLEETAHRISELTKRVDALGNQVGQFGRRLDGFEKQLSQTAVTAQEAKAAGQTATAAAQDVTSLAQQATTASQQTAQEVTSALRQMAEQTNTALQQVSTTAQLAMIEARKGGTAKQAAQPAAQQAPALVKLPPPISISPPAPAVPPAASLASPAQPAAAAQSPADLYKNALNDYTKGNYDLAIEGFRSYISLYPRTGLVANAQYWLGESFYGRKNYGQAIKEFDLFLKEYPDNPKVPGALLKQGFAYLETGDTSRGRTVLNALVKRFPKSQEAKSAKSRLGRIKKRVGSGSGAQGSSKRAS